MNKFFLLSLLFYITLLFSNENEDQAFHTAINYYNNQEYDLAETIIKNLEEKEYQNTLIYFVLGKIYRFKGDSSNAIFYLEKYLNDPSSEKNEMYAKVNLAYEYLTYKREDYFDKAKKIVDELIKSKYRNLGDVTYCYAIVYNAYGFYFLQRDSGSLSGGSEYYKNVSEYFKKSLNARKELVGVANNLAISYIRIIEKLDKKKDLKEIRNYADKTDKLLSDEQYKNFKTGKIQETRDYFYSNFSDYISH